MESKKKLDEVIIKQVKTRSYFSDSVISNPESAVELLRKTFGDLDREIFIVINLNIKNKPINFNIVSIGLLDQALIHPREVLKSAILSNAAKMLIMHNHPSGDLTPSDADLEITRVLSECCDIMNIQLIDHIVFDDQDVYSFRRNNIMEIQEVNYELINPYKGRRRNMK